MILFYKTKNKFYQTKGISTFIFLFFLSISAFGSFTDSNNPKISLNVTNVTLELVLSKIEAQSDYTFFYESNSIDLDRLITIKITNESIDLVLPKIFNQKKISYSIVKHQIILKKIISYTIKGILVNKTNNKVIPYCSISLMNSSIRTSSNELGEFEIKTTFLPAKLIFSHLSYKERTITVTNIKTKLTITLASLENVLDEIVIKAVSSNRKNDRYAFNLVKKAYERILFTSRKNKNTYAKAFYRHKSKNDNKYTEFFEIFFDLHYNINGIKQWNIIQGRYALKRNSINNKNFTLFSRILKSTQPKTNDIVFPLNPDAENYYKVDLVRTFILDSTKIAVIKFTPIKGKKIAPYAVKPFSTSSKELPIFEGEAYINTSNYDVLKINYSIHNDKIKLIRLKERNATRKNHKLSYEITFRKNSFNSLVIDYIKVDQEFDYYKGEKFITHLSSTSNLTFFEYYTNTSTRKRMRKQFRKRYSDWEKLNLVGYDKEFWLNNPIVKRTPIEKKVIADFEKQNKFQFIKKSKQ